MLDELDETIRLLLTAEMPIRNGEIEVTFEQPNRTNTAKWKKPAVNFFLYDLRENNVLRQHQWEQQAAGASRPDMARLKRTPYRLDCYYMMTTWANDPDTEHRLMTLCLMTLFRHPILPAAQLVGSLKNQPYELQAHLASHDRLTNPAEVWASLDNEIRPSVSYIITLALDPWKEVEVPLIQTLTLRPGQAADPAAEAQPAAETQLVPDGRSSEMNLIGGMVREAGGKNPPLAGIHVAVREMIQNAHDTSIIRTTRNESFTHPTIEVTFDRQTIRLDCCSTESIHGSFSKVQIRGRGKRIIENAVRIGGTRLQSGWSCFVPLNSRIGAMTSKIQSEASGFRDKGNGRLPFGFNSPDDIGQPSPPAFAFSAGIRVPMVTRAAKRRETAHADPCGSGRSRSYLG